MKVFVTGWDGLLGSALVPRLRAAHRVEGFGVADADLCDRDYLARRLAAFGPDVVMHLAAYTAVDRCEVEEAEAFRVNETGSRIVAEAAREAGARVLALSTDYVFDGTLDRPWTEEDEPRPLGVYGRSKLAGERAVAASGAEWAVLRSAWLYGPGGPNFVETILRLLGERETLDVVADQTGSPTDTEDLAEALILAAERGASGVYHVACGGEATWCGFAREAARLAGFDPARVRPASTAEIGRPAPRPGYSVLDCSRFERDFGLRLPHWREALARYMERRGSVAGDRT